MSSSTSPEMNPGPVEELRRQLTALKAEVTSQQWLLDALESQSAQYRALFELMPGSVVLVDSMGFVRDANPYFCRAMGYCRDDIVGLHVTKISQEKPEIVKRNIHRMISGETLQHEVVNIQKDGSLRFYELREAAVTLPDGSMNILAVSTDITDRKRAEQSKLEMERQLLEAQKLDSLGVLAGGIAHDFNNLLAVILSNTELAMMELPSGSSMQNRLNDAMLAGKRAAELTRQMLAYSGRGRFVIAEIDLTQLVNHLSDLVKVSVSKTVKVELNLAAALPRIQADAEQLRQVLMNLVTNASEAIGDAPGAISITTNTRECDEAFLAKTRTANKPAPGRYVVLEVKDNGCGMDESVRNKLFEPFFTTKFVGRGLGMSAVLGVVQGHHGAITVSSEPRQGATIAVMFPAAPLGVATAREARGTATTRSASGTLSGTVLVADDEVQVRSLMEFLLKRMGLKVLLAEDGKRAVELFHEHAPEITFALLDLSMPSLDGLKVFAQMRRIRPDVKVVLTSGYDSNDLMRRYHSEGFDGFIQKPCDLETFKKVVYQMCG